MFFFSSRRRHTRCALVTGVQTCALPISGDAGRWLVKEGADPARLSIVGWSYGGYAALQSGVLAPDLFKKIVAIAPVTDLAELKEEVERYTTGAIMRDFIGSGPHIQIGRASCRERVCQYV